MPDDRGTQNELLGQQRVLAEFGSFALKAEPLDDILNKACELVGEALRTDLAKVMNSCLMAGPCGFAPVWGGNRVLSGT